MRPEDLYDLYHYFFIEAGEGAYLHNPDSAASTMACLWRDIVRPHCEDETIAIQIDTMIDGERTMALENFEAEMLLPHQILNSSNSAS